MSPIKTFQHLWKCISSEHCNALSSQPVIWARVMCQVSAFQTAPVRLHRTFGPAYSVTLLMNLGMRPFFIPYIVECQNEVKLTRAESVITVVFCWKLFMLNMQVMQWPLLLPGKMDCYDLARMVCIQQAVWLWWTLCMVGSVRACSHLLNVNGYPQVRLSIGWPAIYADDNSLYNRLCHWWSILSKP